MLKKTASQPVWIAVLAASLAAQAPAAENQAVDELTEVEITGSRIPRLAADTANPVMSVDVGQSGGTNLTNLLIQTPALVHSTTNYDSAGPRARFGETGLNLLNLRNLGPDRTLVLVNGRRHVAGLPGAASVDINTIPVELIERVDVLTGGVSAIYGADGVSGVVNFVTRRNFEGLAFRGQGGVSGHGDADNRFASITGGRNFLGDRGNLVLSYEYNADKRVSTFDRSRTGDPLRTWSLVSNPDDDPDDPAVPDRLLLNNLRYADSSRDGAFDTDWDFAPDFTGSGTPYDRGTFLSSSGFVQGGSSTPLAGYQGDLQPGIKRHSVNLLGNLEISDRLRLFAEAKYVKTDSHTQGQPSFDYFSYLSAENPFIPAAIRAAIVPGAADDAFGLPDGILMTRDHFDLGARSESVERETLRSVLGLDGQLTDRTRYEFSWTYGETAANSLEQGHRIADRYHAALDAVDEGEYLGGVANGHVMCRIDLDPAGSAIDPVNYGGEAQTFTPGPGSGCAPLNLFGEYLVSDAARRFATASARNRAKLSQHVVSGSLTGDLGQLLALPGGPLGYAVGGEYRKERSNSVPDQLIQDGLLQPDLALILPERGSFDVKELFAEINVPVLRDTRFAHSLSFGAAARLSDYSTVGSTTAWKLDARYAPVRDIMFRGTWSEAVRAPNIRELFAPSGSGYLLVDDPCDPSLVGDGSQYRAANCEALLTDLGIDPDTFNPEADPVTLAAIAGTTTGNAQLREEKARTWTVGFLLRPQAVPGLALSFDWYDIKLKNAVNQASAGELAQLCVDQPTLDNVFCNGITRDPGTGYIDSWTSRPENVAKFETSGADFTADYRFAPSDLGAFHLSVSGGYLDKLKYIYAPGAPVDSRRGSVYAPKYLATTDLGWERSGWSANYGINYFSKTRRFTAGQLQANPDLSDPRFFHYKAKWEHELRVGFTPQGSGYSVYAGVNNLFDAKPAPADANPAPGAAARNYPVSFVGRYFYAGVRLKLDQLPW